MKSSNDMLVPRSYDGHPLHQNTNKINNLCFESSSTSQCTHHTAHGCSSEGQGRVVAGRARGSRRGSANRVAGSLNQIPRTAVLAGRHLTTPPGSDGTAQ